MVKHYSRRQILEFTQASLLGLASFSLLSLARQSLATTTVNLSSLETQIPLWLQQNRVAGLSIALVKEGEPFWIKGFGVKNSQSRVPVQPQTVFAAASLSKPLFAWVVLQLIQKGYLDLDTPLTDYTKQPYINDPRIKLITARMVLDHTTGFPNWSGDAPVWIDHTPGTRFGYSGEGYLYLQKVIEALTGESLEIYMQQQAFQPLGMTNSSYSWQDKYRWLASDGHDSRLKPQPLTKPQQPMSAATLRTSAEDFAQFLTAMIVPDTLNNLMLQPQTSVNAAIEWGLGWGLEKTKAGRFFWHTGISSNFTSFAIGSQSLQTALVILTNSANGLKICQLIVEEILGQEHPAFKFNFWS